ncbi:MAG: hypothetical protein HYS56_03330, partial [Candidatus Omnitrophica bacterium]|nr:hypothetical protein [Candidatus Omnitrophota bacterium]
MELAAISQQKQQLAQLPASFYGGWEISLNPWKLSSDEKTELECLGQRLYGFYQACNSLYLYSLRGTAPSWIAEYLDLGKDSRLLSVGHMNRFEHSLPHVIRPDLVKTANGFLACELDSVPGGIGLMTQFQEIHGSTAIIGGKDGMLQSFAQMIRDEVGAGLKP